MNTKITKYCPDISDDDHGDDNNNDDDDDMC